MRTIPLLLLLAGCNEIGISKFAEPGEPSGETDALSLDTDEDPATAEPTPDPTADDPLNPGNDDPGNPDDPFTDGGVPPETLEGACPDGAVAVWQSGELIRTNVDRGPAHGTLTASAAGLFHVYDLSAAESGASQRNESYFLRIPNAANPDGYSTHGTCHGDWVVLDPDNAGPPPQRLYVGTFELDAGDNDVQFFHLCAHVHNGGCAEMLDLSVPGQDCNDGLNSVHFTGEALCIVSAD